MFGRHLSFFTSLSLALVWVSACGIDTASDTPEPYVSPTPGGGTPQETFVAEGRFLTTRVVALEVKNLDENHIFTDPDDDWFTQQITHTLLGDWRILEDGSLLIEEEVCDIEISVIGGIDTVPGPQLLQHLSPIHIQGALGESGRLVTSAVADIWGARLDDPIRDPLPTSPEDAQAWDQDQDGHPGATVLLIVADRGTTFGTTYVAQRVVFALEGQVVSKDSVEGPVRVQGAEQALLDAEEAYIRASEPEVRPSPDATLSYFISRRVKDGLACGDL